MSGGSNAGDRVNLLPLLGKAITAMLRRSWSLELPAVKPSFAGAFLSEQPGEGAKPPPCYCTGHRVLIQAGTARNSISMAPRLPPEPGQIKGARHVFSHTPLAALVWPQCLIAWQMPGQEVRAPISLRPHGAAGPIAGGALEPGAVADGSSCPGWGQYLHPPHSHGRDLPWALPKPRLQLFAPLSQLPGEDGTVMGTAASSGYPQGEGGDPSTSSTPAITFLIQEVRQGHGLAEGKAGLPAGERGRQGCYAHARLGGRRAKLSYKDEEQVCVSAEGSREEEARVSYLQPGTLLPSEHTWGCDAILCCRL